MKNYFKKFRGSPELVRERLSAYVGYFKGCRKVLDLGCGRGEFLGLLKRAGIPALGVDSDPEAIEGCLAAGYDVIKEDLFSFLDANGGFDGIMASQLIEHLDTCHAEHLIESCFDILRPGGIIVIITPNPENLAANIKTFWLDPTHVRPYPLDLIVELLKGEGFEIVAAGDAPNTRPPGVRGIIKRKVLGRLYKLIGLGQLACFLFSGHDIFAIGRRP